MHLIIAAISSGMITRVSLQLYAIQILKGTNYKHWLDTLKLNLALLFLSM